MTISTFSLYLLRGLVILTCSSPGTDVYSVRLSAKEMAKRSPKKKKKRPTQKKRGEGMERREGVGDPRAERKIFYLATASGARDLGTSVRRMSLIKSPLLTGVISSIEDPYSLSRNIETKQMVSKRVKYPQTLTSISSRKARSHIPATNHSPTPEVSSSLKTTPLSSNPQPHTPL
jgi:hypothetical protein